MKLLERYDSGWTIVHIEGHYVEAKVYDTGSMFGINSGRVSKLTIRKNTRDNSAVLFHYDRGWDKGNSEDKLVSKIVEQLETLPKLF